MLADSAVIDRNTMAYIEEELEVWDGVTLRDDDSQHLAGIQSAGSLSSEEDDVSDMSQS